MQYCSLDTGSDDETVSSIMLVLQHNSTTSIGTRTTRSYECIPSVHRVVPWSFVLLRLPERVTIRPPGGFSN